MHRDTEKSSKLVPLAEATLEQGLTDPEREIKDRLRERVEGTCPDLASSILR